MASPIGIDDLDLRHHEVMDRLREQAPVVWVEALDGWVVLRRGPAVDVMRDARTFTVDDPRFSTARVVGPSMLSLDGAEQLRHRQPFADPLRPAEATARHGAAIDAAADELVAALVPNGGGELRRELAGPLAVAVAAGTLGLGHVPAPRLLAVYDRIVAAVDTVARGGAVTADGLDAVAELSAEIRVAMADPTSLVAHAHRTLDDAATVSNSAVFLFGGIETSEGMTSNALLHLLSHPPHWDAVVRDPELADAAVEESLRLEPAAARVDRYATADVELGGASIRRGDLVIVSLAAANRDPEVFEAPHEFRLDRVNARQHVSFAVGPHGCIGAQLARMETRAAIRSLARRAPGARLVEPVVPTGVVFRKPAALRVCW